MTNIGAGRIVTQTTRAAHEARPVGRTDCGTLFAMSGPPGGTPEACNWDWLQAVLRSIGDAVIATDAEQRVLFMNPVAESLTGWKGGEASGKRISEVFRIDDKNTGATTHALTQNDGRSIPIENIITTPIHDADGNLAGAVLVFRKVNQDSSERHYRSVAETASDAIITIDENSTIVFASSACEKIFGYAPGEVTGKNLTMLMPRAFREAHLSTYAHYLKTGEKRLDWGGVELPGLHRDGREIPIEISFAEFLRDGKRFVTGVVRDITDRKRIQEALKTERERTERALEMHQKVEQQVMLLVEASATLMQSLDTGEVIERIVDLAAQFIEADAYAVWRTDNTHWRPVSSRGLSEAYRKREVDAHSRNMPEAPMLIEDVEREEFLAHRSEDYRQEGIRAMLVIPLRLHGHISGTITFYYRTPHRASDSEIRIATALGNLAAAALTTAELYENQSRMRAEAESNERHSTFLSEATTVLASSLSYEATLSAVARLAVPHFADWCAVDMLTPEHEIQRLAVAHIDSSKVEWAKELERLYPADPNSDRGLPQVLRSGEYQVANNIPDEVVESSARDERHLQMLREIGLRSYLCVPLIARARTLGALTFVTTHESGRDFGPAEIELAFHLARRSAIAVDNAELYRAAERRREQAEETAELLRQSNEDLEQFAYVSSHDLQEPLRMIGSYVQLIQRRYQGQLDPDADDFIAYIVEGVDRMQRLLRDLLEYARVGYRGLQVHLIDSAAALDDAVTNLKIAVEESGTTITHSTLPRIKADRLQLTRLFQNLISNSIKFRGDAPLQVHVSATRGEGEWVFSVRDNAMGFDEAFAKKAFVIFQRLHGREYPGTGIGLAISKRIVERRGGRIWVESESGVGSTFFFSVPDAVRAESPPAPDH